MATNFPTSIDALTNPLSTDGLNSPDHAAQHANVNDAVEAIEAAIGTTAAPVLAKLASPTFTGTPAAPTAAAGTNTTQLATTAFVTTADNLKANLASPSFTGTLSASVISNSGTITSYSGTSSITFGAWSASSAWSSVEGANGYLLMGNSIDKNIYLRSNSATEIRIGGNGNNILNVNQTGTTALGYIAVGGTGITDTGSVSCNGWFRSQGGTGWYNQTYGGGIYMDDSTYVKVYNGKIFYNTSEIRTASNFSGDTARQRGSYGAITIGNNGRAGGWSGLEFVSPEAQTFMVYTNQYSGMYRDNTTWNWQFNYSTLAIGSDERYKREIQPLGLGMKFIEHLQPISYLKLTENPEDEPEATEQGYYYGFTAQNVRAALDLCGETRDVKIHDIGGPNMGLVACVEGAVYDRQYIGITEFIAPVVEAIKELNERIKTLERA